MHEQRWREVCSLTVQKLVNADDFLLAMSKRNNVLLNSHELVTQFLKTQALKNPSEALNDTPYKVRAFWGEQALARARARARASDLTSEQTLVRNLTSASGRVRASANATARDLAFELALNHAHQLTNADAPIRTCAPIRISQLARAHDLAFDLALDLNLSSNLNFSQLLKDASTKASREQFKSSLEELQREIEPVEAFNKEDDTYWSWWEKRGERWTELFREVLITYRNIGHKWQFTNEDLKLLERYYYGSKLIIDCLNSECYVSREVRQQIEDTLLIPPDPA